MSLPTLLTPSASASGTASRPAGPAARYIVDLRSGAVTDSVMSGLRGLGATKVDDLSALHELTLTLPTVAKADAARLPGIARVLPDGAVPGPTVTRPSLTIKKPTSKGGGKTSSTASPDTVSPNPTNTRATCGTAQSPEVDPEALSSINAVPGTTDDGSGVTVATLADGVDPQNADLQRNPAYASASSPAGSPVITDYQDFGGDGPDAATEGGEAFLDVGSIAAQGNVTYDLSNYVSSANPLPPNCDITITGDAPGASLIALKIFADNEDTTASGFVQAINYAVVHGAKVINESFGSNDFPDTSMDAVRVADDAAVRAGVTVVVSSGDAGISNTIGSPSSDPHVISVGASTTYRAYEQDSYGGSDVPGANGQYLDKNISDLSSGGVTQGGRAIDLVAPGDLNWTLCQADLKMYSDCSDDNGNASNIQLSGGTSESAPLTSGAAADVISAYADSHEDRDPSPALVKRILMSTAKDIAAPADQQGAGLLDVGAAVKLAQSVGGTGAGTGGVLVNTEQLDVSQQPGRTTTKTVSFSNTSSSPETVHLATRSLTGAKSSARGVFCMQPGKATKACPKNTGTLLFSSGYPEVYQSEPFTVAPSTSPLGSRLRFTMVFPYVGQSSVVHVALFAPDGALAEYSEPQGLADYADLEVANPQAGTWQAVFFTGKNNAAQGVVGSSGPIQWQATTQQYAAGDKVSPATLTIPAGKSATAKVNVKASPTPGDAVESLLVNGTGIGTTVPVVNRTMVPMKSSGGSFTGVLTGGNGRAGAQAEGNTYVFQVAKHTPSIHVRLKLANDPNDELTAFLVDPKGQTVGYSTNYTAENYGTPTSTTGLDLYHLAPSPGRWTLDLQLANPVNGTELTEPFKASITLGQKHLVVGRLPDSRKTMLKKGKTRTFTLQVSNNSGAAPQAFFVDPRTSKKVTLKLADINGSDKNMKLPLAPGLTFPVYAVPTHTTAIDTVISGNTKLTFDESYGPGDPDLSPTTIQPPASTGGNDGNSAELRFKEPEISPGVWLVNPAEFGPYSDSGEPAARASVSMKATTRGFDSAVTSSTGDFWSAINGLSAKFNPQYVPVGDSTTIKVHVKPTAKPGTVVHGVVYVDDYVLSESAEPNADELAAIPYTYTVTKK